MRQPVALAGVAGIDGDPVMAVVDGDPAAAVVEALGAVVAAAGVVVLLELTDAVPLDEPHPAARVATTIRAAADSRPRVGRWIDPLVSDISHPAWG